MVAQLNRSRAAQQRQFRRDGMYERFVVLLHGRTVIQLGAQITVKHLYSITSHAASTGLLSICCE